MNRFSKSALLAHIHEQIVKLINEHDIDVNTGISQIYGRSEQFVLYYGEFSALNRLYDQIDGGYIGK